MTDVEKLIELIVKCDKQLEVLEVFRDRPTKAATAEIIANYLIANGVVIRESCGDCMYKGNRHQKCSCCTRNKDLKDCYEPGCGSNMRGEGNDRV